MHTAIISFADRVVYNIKTNDMKDVILDLLYNLYGIKIIQKHYHKVDENNVKHIKANPHMCCLRSNGNPYYMFFTTYDEVPIVYFIDKKVHPGYQKPRILLVRGMFDESLFKNTLIDGEMVKTNENKWMYVMNDIIVHKGKHLNSAKLSQRISILYEILEKEYTPDSTIDVCDYKIKTYFDLSKDSIQKLIDISKRLNYTCRGIYLWPHYLKYKPKLYNFCEENIISVVRKVKDETEFQHIGKKEDVQQEPEIAITVPLTVTDKEQVLWLVQTEHPDVYNLYETENTLATKKAGVALIPNLVTSKMVRNAFKNKNSVCSIKSRCMYNDTFNKWFPVAIL